MMQFITYLSNIWRLLSKHEHTHVILDRRLTVGSPSELTAKIEQKDNLSPSCLLLYSYLPLTCHQQLRSAVVILFVLLGCVSVMWGAENETHDIFDVSSGWGTNHNNQWNAYTTKEWNNLLFINANANNGGWNYVGLGCKKNTTTSASIGTTTATTYPIKKVTIHVAVYRDNGNLTINNAHLYVYSSYSNQSYSDELDNIDVSTQYTADNNSGTITIEATPTSGTTWTTGVFFNFVVNITNNEESTASGNKNHRTGIDKLTLTEGSTGSTKTLTYIANGATGGSVPTDATAYSVGGNATVKGNTGGLYKVGFTFAGWNTAANGSGASYAAGDEYTIASSGNTLYAQWTNTYAGAEFSLVEDLTDIQAGSKIIILNEGYNYAISRSQATNNRTAVSASAADNAGFTMSNNNKTVTLGSATTVQVITLEDLATPATNTYQFNVENGYLYANGTSSSYYLKTQTSNDSYGHWLIELLNGSFTLAGQGGNSNNKIKKNSSSALFSCYSSGQQNVLVYFKDDAPKYNISWSNNGHGTAPTSPTNASRVTLPDIDIVGYIHTGWKANQNVTNVSTSATITSGTLITNGTRVLLGANTTFTAQWETETYTVTTSGLTNMSPTTAFPSDIEYTGETSTALNRTLAAADGYVLPATITVTMGGAALTAGTDYSYNSSTGSFSISKVITDNIVISGSANLRLDGITITTHPSKLAYFVGESFSNTGAVVTATMGNGTTKTVSAIWTPPATPLVAGASQTVNISYTENGMTKTTTETINVYSVTVNKVNENGEAVDVSGVTAGWTVATKGLSASASLASKYVFKEWEFANGENQGLSFGSAATTTPNTVSGTPTGNVVINAVFWAPRNVVWMVNGEEYTAGSPTSTIAYNSSWSDLTLPTDPTPPCGDKFMGWTTTDIGSTGQDSDAGLDLMTGDNKASKSGNKITAATVTFHAVFADYVEPAD